MRSDGTCDKATADCDAVPCAVGGPPSERMHRWVWWGGRGYKAWSQINHVSCLHTCVRNKMLLIKLDFHELNCDCFSRKYWLAADKLIEDAVSSFVNYLWHSYLHLLHIKAGHHLLQSQILAGPLGNIKLVVNSWNPILKIQGSRDNRLWTITILDAHHIIVY